MNAKHSLHGEAIASHVFDPAAYQASGRCPWTFFAFPRELAQAEGRFPKGFLAERCEQLYSLSGRTSGPYGTPGSR
jgi:hypothetical protein